MRLRWLMAVALLLIVTASARASKRADLPTSGYGELNSCVGPNTGQTFVSHVPPPTPYDPLNSGPPFTPVVQLAPLTVTDPTSHVSYTVHVDIYDYGSLLNCTVNLDENRASDTHSLIFVYIGSADGTVVSPVTLKTFTLGLPLSNPNFFVCNFQASAGWQLCDSPGAGQESQSTTALQPAPSPGADGGTNTVWSFGLPLDIGSPGSPGTVTPLFLNQNSFYSDTFTVSIDNQSFPYDVTVGTAVLVADGTVQCTPPAGQCNNFTASTPYSASFTGTLTPNLLTVSSFPSTPATTSAAGHDTVSNPVVLTGAPITSIYDVSKNSPSSEIIANQTVTSGVTFDCAGTIMQQYRSVYFQYTAPATTQVYVSTAGSHYDTVLSVTGGAVDACNDDNDPNAIGLVTSSLTFQAIAGTTYRILVTEYPPVQATIPSKDSSFQATDDTYTAPLSGDSTLYFTLSTPQLTPAPVSFTSFGSVAVGMSSPQRTIQLTSNTANFGYTGITNVAATASGDFHVAPASCATPVPDSNPCVLTVTFSPTAAGTRTGTLTITSAGSSPAENTPINFMLTGVGTAPGPVNVTTTGGTNGYVPQFAGETTAANSILHQYNGGIGIGRAPAATLDVNGKSIFRGGMDMSRLGDATPTAGATSSPLQMQSSVYNSSIKNNLLPYFQLETEPIGNNTASTGATLNFLYYSGIGCCASETGLYINPNGTIHFAAGQTFPAPAVANPAAIAALRGDPGPAGPVGGAGPSGFTGTDIAVSGTAAAARGFVSESSSSSTAPFMGSNSADGATVMAMSSTGKAGYGVLARSAYVGLYAQGTSYAARFNGALATDSNLASSGASYRIPDPLHPDAPPSGSALSHAAVSAPGRMNLYNGIVVTDATGTAIVAMPRYFEALNREFQYQLTVIGQFSRAIVATPIANGVFTIRTEKPNVKVSWQVTGVRQDAWAIAHPVPIESTKESPSRGRDAIPRRSPEEQ